MKVHCAAQALKETLSVGEVKASVSKGITLSNNTPGICIGISDGGDGFIQALQESDSIELQSYAVPGPMGDPVSAPLAVAAGSAAFIEMATASGLALVQPNKRNIWRASTAGTGHLLYHAHRLGATSLTIGLGGSATNDGGIGMFGAVSDLLGFTRFNRNLSPQDLEAAFTIPLPRIAETFAAISLTACTDVTNPLLGSLGCAAVFGPQKGASPEMVLQLEAMMTRWANHLEASFNTSLRNLPGAGAAGGMGFAFAAMGATLEPGAQMFLRRTGFLSALSPGDIVLTTEGRFDRSSMMGKAPWVVATTAREHGAHPFIVCGTFDPAAAEDARAQGVRVVAFGEKIPPQQRTENSPAAITATVQNMLEKLKYD